MSSESTHRLPRHVYPIHYDLTFEPDFSDFTFSGTASIAVQVKERTKSLQLHASELDILNVALRDSKVEKEIQFKEVADEKIEVYSPEELTPGNYSLDFNFKGILNDKMYGFYRSVYTCQSDNRCVVQAITQLEPAYARKVFPCWDEPSFKATFDVTLVVPKEKIALSNMPIISENVEGNSKHVKFDRTLIMSPYLLAFVIGEFDYIEKHDENGIMIRVYTPLGKKSHGEFALEVACKVLPYYVDYFGLKYPLPKLDLVAIPDFAAGAMENWGLITYREAAVLIDPTNSSKNSEQYVSLVISHELAHQWFGNLVTMDWWSDLWLNEGFASWIEFLAVDALFPYLNVWTQFVYLDFKRAQQLDSLRNSHPIEVEVHSPAEVDQIFDSISYNKGSSIIRMLYHYLGDEAFRKGLRKYLSSFQFNNACTQDLWNALGLESNIDVKSIMSTWTEQVGFPVVRICKQEVQGDDLVLYLEQTRFIASGEIEKGSLWKIPINVTFASMPTTDSFKFVMNNLSEKVLVPKAGKEKWIKLNTNSVGFYIVEYPVEMLRNIFQSISDLPAVDRFSLQSDLFTLCISGVYQLVEYLRTIELAAQSEEDYTVWRDIDSNIGHISTITEYLQLFPQMKKFHGSLLTKCFAKLGWTKKPNEDDLCSMLRPVIIRGLGLCGDQAIITECLNRFNEIGDANPIDPNLRLAVYSVVAYYGNDETLTKLMDMHKVSDFSEEKNRLLTAMGYVRSADCKRKVLEYCLSEHVRSQDIFYGFASVADSQMGRELTWEFFKEKFDIFNARYKESSMMGSLIKRSFGEFCSREAALDIEKFFELNPVPIAERAIKQVIECIEMNCLILERNDASLREFFN